MLLYEDLSNKIVKAYYHVLDTLGTGLLEKVYENAMCIELEEMGFEVEASHHEVAPGQHEIDFKYADAITACDNIQTFKLVIHIKKNQILN